MFTEPGLDPVTRAQLPSHLRERALSALATTQKGVVRHEQLVAIGFSPSAIARLLDVVRLQPLHRGVYAVGHGALHRHARWMGAVLACGDGTLLAHRDCAALRDLLPVPSGRICVAVVGDAGRGHRGIRPLERSQLTDADRDVVDGIPWTSVARMALDLACDLRPSQLLELLEETVRRNLFDLAAFGELLDRCRGQRGVRRLAAAMALLTDDPDLLRGELERHLRERILVSSLPRGRHNRHVRGASGRLWEVDVWWPDAGLVVEADSRAYHSSPAARRRDERKQADLEAAGQEVWRVRWFDTHAGWPALEARLFTRTRS